MVYKPFDLSGKVCVVTGGNKGIGLGMVEALAASNADVVIWGRKTADNDAAVQSASGLGTGKVKAWAVDVGEESQVIKAMKEAEEEFGRIDCCIANAGVGRGAASFETMTLETWEYNARINSVGAFFTLREAAKSMVARAKKGDLGGSLVGTASLAVIEGAGRNQAYAHTKGGLIANVCQGSRKSVKVILGLAQLQNASRRRRRKRAVPDLGGSRQGTSPFHDHCQSYLFIFAYASFK